MDHSEEVTARQRIAGLASGDLDALTWLVSHDEPQRALQALARAAKLEASGTCADDDVLDRFCAGLMHPRDQAALACHAACCATCSARLEAQLDAGQHQQQREVVAAVARLRERSFANARREVHQVWRTHLIWNIFHTLAELAVAVFGAVAVLPLLTDSGDVTAPPLLSVGTLVLSVVTALCGYLAIILWIVRRWRVRALVPALHEQWFVVAPAAARAATSADDLVRSWKRVAALVVLCGQAAYAFFGLTAGRLLDSSWPFWYSVGAGMVMNLIAWRGLSRVAVGWATEPRPPLLAADQLPSATELLARHWHLLGAIVFAAVAISVARSPAPVLVPFLVPAACLLIVARIALPLPVTVGDRHRPASSDLP